MAVTYSDRSLQRVDVLSSFRWSAIAAGVLAALATQILLSTIGGAIGVSATAVTENEDAARGLGIGAGIWFVLSPLISMFVGGMVASWMSRPVDRGVALVHGALVWCVSLVIGAFFIGTLATTAVSGALGTASTAAVRTATGDGDGKSLRAEAKETKAEAKARANDPEVKKAADDAANIGTGVAWASVFAMVLSLGAALLGATAAHRAIYAPAVRNRRFDVRHEDEVSPIVSSGREIRTESRLDGDRPDLH